MKRLLTFISVLIMIISCTSCGTAKAYQKTILTVFDTVTVISGYEKSQAEFDRKTELIEAELTRYHTLYDIYGNYGENNLQTVNLFAGKEAVTVDRDIIEMLSYGKEMYEKTNGMTNIAVGAVTALWHEARETGKLPDDAALKEAAKHIDINSIQIDRESNTVFITDKNARIDVGAVAKGYACDKVCEMMREKGFTSYGLSVGGNVQTVGKKADGADWSIGVQNPDGTFSYFCTLLVTDAALVTSGSYQRYFEVDGVRYHHIIHPDTLYPQNNFTSVSVLCPSSALGDVLSTALFNMTYEEGLELIKTFSDTEVLWRYADGSCKYTNGLENIISFTN